MTKEEKEYVSSVEKYLASGCKDLDAKEDMEAYAYIIVNKNGYENMTYKALYEKLSGKPLNV